MDFMKLFGAVIAVFFHSGSAAGINGEKICRHGTGRPCYKVFYMQDSRQRLTFDDARHSCMLEGGDLLSIETESEQRLMERFIQELRAGDVHFWIGLRRRPQHHTVGTATLGCPSQYYWLDGSNAKYRNWHWAEPSCGSEMCVVLHHKPSAAADEGHFLFQWNDENCSSKKNFVCKYREEKLPVFKADRIPDRIPTQSDSPLKPNSWSTTETDGTVKKGLPHSSVSFSDEASHISYILYATIPALLLLLFAGAGFFCYRQHAKRKKTKMDSSPQGPKPSMTEMAPPCPVQGPYAFSDVTQLSPPALDYRVHAVILAKYSRTPSCDPQCGDYENVACSHKDSGFVSNDIYEPCNAQSLCRHDQTGWVENEIYG